MCVIPVNAGITVTWMARQTLCYKSGLKSSMDFPIKVIIMTYICVFLQNTDALAHLADPRYSLYQGHNSFREKYFSGLTKKNGKGNGKEPHQTRENDG